MLRIFLTFILVCLAIVGITEIIKFIGFLIIAPSKDLKQFIVLVPSDDDVEYSVRSFAEKIRWDCYSYNMKAIVVDDGLSKDSLKICKRLIKEYDGLTLIKKEDFQNLI